jgi:hypothetical protein
MAEQMIRDDNISDRNGHKSIVADKLGKQVVPEKGKKTIKGKGKASAAKRIQTRWSESFHNHVLTNRIRRNIK